MYRKSKYDMLSSTGMKTIKYPKVSEAKKGEKNPMYGRYGPLNPMFGYRFSDEEKMAKSVRMKGMFKGQAKSQETKKKISEAKRGKPSKSKGIKRPWLSLRNKLNNPMAHYTYTAEELHKRSLQSSGVNNPMYGKKGPLSPVYKGGKTPIQFHLRQILEYDDWRRAVYKRDGYTCQECGDNAGHNLEPHHIKPVAQILFENNIKTIDESRACQELWNVDNGQTLCIDCHKKTPSYAKNVRKRRETP